MPKQSKIDAQNGLAVGLVKTRKDGPIATEAQTEAEIMQLAPPRPRKPTPKPEIVNQISQRLGDVYKDVLKQPVPDRFLDLLQALEAGTAPVSDRAKKEPK